MRRGTTPTVRVDAGADLRGCWYRVAFRSGDATVVKDQSQCSLSGDGRVVSAPLTQEDTLSFRAGRPLYVQVRFGRDGRACATDVARLEVGQVLDEEAVG